MYPQFGDQAPPPVYENIHDTYSPYSNNTEQNSAVLNEEDVREALAQFVSENCCFGKSPLKHIQIMSIEPATNYHYHLETFMEKRTIYKGESAYDGGPVDGPMCGPPVDMWSAPVAYPEGLFKDAQVDVPLPHTTQLERCGGCLGQAITHCATCGQTGQVSCKKCEWTTVNRDMCLACHGAARLKCESCDGRGVKVCDRCKGNGRVKSFTGVKITAKVVKQDKVIDCKKNTPKDLAETIAKDATGIVLFHDEKEKVLPIANMQDHLVTRASKEAIDQVAAKHADWKIIRQRHQVSAIPVSEVMCSHKGKVATFFVYGTNHKVYFPNYFAKCSCTII